MKVFLIFDIPKNKIYKHCGKVFFNIFHFPKRPTLPKLPFPSTLWNTRWFMVRRSLGAVGVTAAGLTTSWALPPAVSANT